MLRGKKGITLIALVITIIVLLILAGVTIATLTGENGILTKASEASQKTEVANEQEQVELAYTAASSNNWGEDIMPEDIQKELEKLVGENKTKTTENGNGTINVEFLDTKNNYNINEGIVTQIDKNATSYELLYDYREVDGGVSITGLTTGRLLYNNAFQSIHEKYSELTVDFLWKLFFDNEITEEDIEKTGFTTEELQQIFNEAISQVDSDKIENQFIELLPQVGKIPKKIQGKSVVEIGNNAFELVHTFNVQLTNVVIPDTVKKIGESAFSECQIKEISIPDSVTEIGRFAFTNNLLTNLTIPSSVQTIGNGAFARNQLTKVVFLGMPSTVAFATSEDIRGVFANNIQVDVENETIKESLIENSIQVPTGTLEYFVSKIPENWLGVSEECFYE